MSLQASFESYKLDFIFNAGTSRGVLTERITYFLKIWDSEDLKVIGLGEAAPLSGLSPDQNTIEKILDALCKEVKGMELPSSQVEINNFVKRHVRSNHPAVRFALEMALLDYFHGGKRFYVPGGFIEGTRSIPINGLVWMGSFDSMRKQIDAKHRDGYKCIKIKIGALDFQEECNLLAYIRENYGDEISIRVDANGAFTEHNVFERLTALSEYNLHSIEQPIKPGQWELLGEICREALVPVALDEELIGITSGQEQAELLETVTPQYIVLKPTLLGGLDSTSKWIRLAESKNIGWWITSALESNIGLSALAQYTASLNPELPQGLGTGQLYHNNIPSKLSIGNGYLHYQL